VREEYPGVVLAGGGIGTTGGLLVRSTDFGDKWESVPIPIGVVSVDFDGAGSDVIFAAGSDKIVRSRDGGGKWETVWDGSGLYRIAKLAYDASTERVYAAGRSDPGGGSGLLLIGTDAGNVWRQILLSSGPVVDLGLSGDWIYLATGEDGVFRARQQALDSEGALQSAMSDNLILQNYPNPFAAVTTIRYSLVRSAETRLTVFDLLGRRLRTVSYGWESSGTHEVAFDATDLPAGVYVYLLRAGNYVVTRRMVVVR